MIFRFIDWIKAIRHQPIKKEWLHPVVIEYVLMHQRRGLKKESVIYEIMQMNQITYHEAYALYLHILKHYQMEHINKNPDSF